MKYLESDDDNNSKYYGFLLSLGWPEDISISLGIDGFIWLYLTINSPFWEDQIAPKLLDGKNVVIAAHGNSLRALSKYIERISDDDIMNLEMATGEQVVYDFDDKLNMTNKTKLGK